MTHLARLQSFIKEIAAFIAQCRGRCGALAQSPVVHACVSTAESPSISRVCFPISQARQARAIGGVGEGLVEGGDALAQGFVRGFTGLVTKPLAGARTGVGGAHLPLSSVPVSAPNRCIPT